ncbi:hypothetical protein BDY19DRAFT_481 [Irpex rosettiformis]|uniref:Uncharacterized protein n=1 Tax=Irpex rosettiformis TaxID=378272 RepID=A0ACB8UII3_9APHY|nr:hypothetical protein BDY19DRAFT_481 [Irpex rosettiformis]
MSTTPTWKWANRACRTTISKLRTWRCNTRALQRSRTRTWTLMWRTRVTRTSGRKRRELEGPNAVARPYATYTAFFLFTIHATRRFSFVRWPGRSFPISYRFCDCKTIFYTHGTSHLITSHEWNTLSLLPSYTTPSSPLIPLLDALVHFITLHTTSYRHRHLFVPLFVPDLHAEPTTLPPYRL